MTDSARLHSLIVVMSSLVGLAIGSFLNVVIYRVPRRMSIAHPPSHCPTCATSLSALDNVPLVSWLMLRGKCRSCSTPISARYPLVEACTGTIFGLAAAWVRPLDMAVSVMVVAAGAIVAAGIDTDRIQIPGGIAALTATGFVSLSVISGLSADRLQIFGIVIGVAAPALAAFLSGQLVRRSMTKSPTSMRVDIWAIVVFALLGGTAGRFWWPAGLVLAGCLVVLGGLTAAGTFGDRFRPTDSSAEGSEPRPIGLPAVPLAWYALATAFIALGAAAIR